MHFRGVHRGGRKHEGAGTFLSQQFHQLTRFMETAVRAGVKRFVFRPRPRSSSPAMSRFRRIAAWSDECVRPYQTFDRGDTGMVPPDPWTAIRGSALFQCQRRAAQPRRGAPARVASHPARIARSLGNASRRTSTAQTIPRPMAPASAITSTLQTWSRAPAGAGRTQRTRPPDLQPRERERLLGPRSDRDGASGHGTSDPGNELPRRPGDSARLVASSEKSNVSSAGSRNTITFVRSSPAPGSGIKLRSKRI
jgi:hypothetical protein